MSMVGEIEALKQREAMCIAISAHLRNLERAPEKLEQDHSPQENFARLKALFHTKAEEFKKRGLSVAEFVQEVQIRMQSKEKHFSFEGERLS